MHITLDTETIPSQLPWVREYIAETIKPPAQMKKAETIAKWEAEEKQNAIDEALDKCALDGAFNHIVCIGFQLDDDEPQALVAETIEDEPKIIRQFFKIIEDTQGFSDNVFIGHNIVGFDLKIIKQRCMILGIPVPRFIPLNTKPWDSNPYDTMTQWDAKNFVKLDKIARALGIEGKNEEQNVYEWWRNKEFERLATYCKQDVSITRKVYKRMTWQTY